MVSTTSDERQARRSAATGKTMLLFQTLADAGFRPGEALALHCVDMDLADRTFTVARQGLEPWTR
jgi:integrase